MVARLPSSRPVRRSPMESAAVELAHRLRLKSTKLQAEKRKPFRDSAHGALRSHVSFSDLRCSCCAVENLRAVDTDYELSPEIAGASISFFKFG